MNRIRNKYKRQFVLGRGAFGVTWKANKVVALKPKDAEEEPQEQKTDILSIAIKIVPLRVGVDGKQQYEKELELMKRATGCPYVVQMYGYEEVKKRNGTLQLWIGMEFCDGGSLRGYISKHHFSDNHIAAICKQTLLGLQLLHSKDVVHRDIKADNLLWTSKGVVKIGDLGTAFDKSKERVGEESINGSPFWMSPELAVGGEYDEKIDIWALGITAIELVEKNPPNAHLNPMMVLFRLTRLETPPQLQNSEKHPQDFVDFVKQCLIIAPADRPSAGQLLQHPFIQRAKDEDLVSLAQQYCTEKALKDEQKLKEEQTDDTGNVVREEVTGETMEEFMNNLLTYKMNNIETIQKLCTTRPDERPRSRSFFRASGSLENSLDIFQTVVQLAAKASSNTFGVIVIDRTQGDQAYPNCFIGRELVDWLYVNLNLHERGEASTLMCHMMTHNLITSVTNTGFNEIDSDNFFQFNRPHIKKFAKRETEIISGTIQRRKPTFVSGEEREVAPLELSNRDWQLLFSTATLVTFEKGDVVVKEGEYNGCMWRIAEGNVRVHKDGSNTSALRILGENSVFGEVSVLDPNGKASASIIAEETPTKIWRTESYVMFILFKTEPGLHHRFHKYLATKLARNLRNVGQEAELLKQDKEQIETVKRNKSGDNFQKPQKVKEPHDKEFWEIFGLPEDELALQEYPSFLDGVSIKEHGRLYISQHYVCFRSKIFGKRTKQVLPIRSLKEISFNEEKKKIKFQYKRRDIAFVILTDAKACYSLVLSLKSTIEATGSSDYKLKRPNLPSKQEFGKSILSDSDWQVLLAEGKLKTYQKDDVIIAEEQYSARIWQVARGSCRLQKSSSIRFGTKITAGEVLGEISFLEGVKTTASVIADEDDTLIYVLEARNLKVTFRRAPALAGRFYEYLASTLSRRLNATQNRYYAIDATKKTPSSFDSKEPKSEPTSPVESKKETVPSLTPSVSLPEVFSQPPPKHHVHPSPKHRRNKRK